MGLVYEHRTTNDGLPPGRPAARFSLDPEVRMALCWYPSERKSA
jgi:hypothetical protein